MKEYRLYLLDFDGTLADSARSLVNVYRAGFEEIGFPYDPEMASVYMHMSLGETAKMAGIPEKEYVRFALKINDALDYPENLKAIDFFPESKEVMEILHRAGKKLSIVSGNTERHIRLILEAQGIENLFDTVVGSVVDRESMGFSSTGTGFTPRKKRWLFLRFGSCFLPSKRRLISRDK